MRIVFALLAGAAQVGCEEPEAGVGPPEDPGAMELTGATAMMPDSMLSDEGGGFSCDDAEDCWEKCEAKLHDLNEKEQDGNSWTSCSCDPVGGGGFRCTPKKWVDAGGGTGEGVGGGCGGGGGIGGGGVLADRNCNSPVVVTMLCFGTLRGGTGWCEATVPDTTFEPDDLLYRWSSSPGNANEYGRGKKKWEGTATSDRTISVKVLDGSRPLGDAEGDIRVQSRTWRMQSLSAGPQYRSLPSPVWGLYWVDPGWGEPSVKSGDGPWDGEYILDTPTGGSPQPFLYGMFLHNDLDPLGPTHKGANDTTQVCRAAASLPPEANVHTVNHTCGTGGTFDKFRDRVLKHENKHQDSGNLCIRSAATSEALENLETAVGSEDDVREALYDLWHHSRDGLAGKLTRAFLTHETEPGALIWDWRNYQRWAKWRVPGAIHDGTKGCP